jgi:hypothetical protein
MLSFRQYDELRYASPFRPFRIVLTDGKNYDVPHRDFTWRAPNANTIVIAIGKGEQVYYMVDPLHVVRFEYIKGNGQARRTRKAK